VAAGKEIIEPVVFQGGLAFNRGMVRAFEGELKTRLVIPEHPELMGAIGAALLAGRPTSNTPSLSRVSTLNICGLGASQGEL
jgi:activator of 2-hydroxyglutaryl-CoA dehydratase